jgi:hypothetical protein
MISHNRKPEEIPILNYFPLANIVLSEEQTASCIYLKDVHGGATAVAVAAW